MPSKNPAQRLADIIENIDAIEAFAAGLDFAAFCADRKTVYAVVRALEIISEASRRLPSEIQQRAPEIDWAAVAAAGNMYRHEYDAVEERTDLAHHPARSGGATAPGKRGVGSSQTVRWRMTSRLRRDGEWRCHRRAPDVAVSRCGVKHTSDPRPCGSPSESRPGVGPP